MGSNPKKYYWLKLPENFFTDNLALKKLRSIAGGDTYTIIYLKMLLKTLKTDGIFYYEGADDNIVEEMAMAIDEDAENVRVTVNFLKAKGLLEEGEDQFFLNQLPLLVGSEGDSAERMRQFRERKKQNILSNSSQSNALPSHCDSYVTKCDTEKEKEIEIEIDTDIDTRDKEDNNIITAPTSGSPKQSKPKKPTAESIPMDKVVISLQCQDGTEYPFSQDDIDLYADTYPGVDILGEMKKMKMWCMDNPTRRKTARGMRRFVSGWLEKAQNSYHRPNYNQRKPEVVDVSKPKSKWKDI